MQHAFAKYLNILLMLAVITAGISPACKFISGEQGHWIEICGADGTLRTIKVEDPNLAALDVGGTAEDQNQEQNSSEGCDFCFMQAHMNLDLAKPVHKASMLPQAKALIAYQGAALIQYRKAAFSARAPPQYILS